MLSVFLSLGSNFYFSFPHLFIVHYTDPNVPLSGPGHTQGDVDHASHPFGLHVPAGIVSSTGIAGLTLGGGHGYLSRQYGLTIDNLLEVDVVLADGTLVTASESKHPDLFWAIRGGGGNFGIVTSFLFQAKPVDMIFGGPIFFAQKDAATVMKWYGNYAKNLEDRKMSVFLGLKNVPSSPPFPEDIWGRKICALVTCYDGPAEKGEQHIKAITDALPAPIFQFTGPMPFTAIQTLFDPLLPAGMQWYWKGDYVNELPDEAIEAHLKMHDQIPDGLSLMHLYPINVRRIVLGMNFESNRLSLFLGSHNDATLLNPFIPFIAGCCP